MTADRPGTRHILAGIEGRAVSRIRLLQSDSGAGGIPAYIRDIPTARAWIGELRSAVSEDGEPMNRTDKDWVRVEIRDAISAALYPSGWGKAMRFAREWGAVTVYFTAFLTMVAITVAAVLQTRAHYRDDDAHVADEAAFRARTQDALARIEETLSVLRAAKVLTEVAGLPIDQVAERLSAIREATAAPAAEVGVSPTVVEAVADKLASVPQSAPGYWPTVVQFSLFALSTHVRLPPGLESVPQSGTMSVADASFEGVDFLMNGGEFSGVVFQNSRVTVTNRPVRLTEVIFADCIIVLPVSADPPPHIREIARQILRSAAGGIIIVSTP